MSASNSSVSKKHASVFELSGVPAFGQALPLALQHVVAMIVGCVTPSIIIAGVAGISDSDRVILIQAALFCSAISTLLQLFPFIKFGNFQLGSALPVIMGISFAYVPSMQAIAGTYDIATILGAQVVGGVIAIIVGLFIRKIRVLFPPLVTGTVVFTIGLSLYPTAVNYMAGGTSGRDLRFLAELAGSLLYAGCRDRAESLRERLSETGLHPDRYYSRLHPCHSFRPCGSVGCTVRRMVPASPAHAFFHEL